MSRENKTESVVIHSGNKSKPKKVVIFTGYKPGIEINVIKEYLEANGLSDSVILYNQYEHDLTDLPSLNLKELTDTNTIYVILAHGITISKDNKTLHYIDMKTVKSINSLDDFTVTGMFINHVKKEVNRDIDAILLSCMGGGTLRDNIFEGAQIDKGISMMARSSSKHSTSIPQDL